MTIGGTAQGPRWPPAGSPVAKLPELLDSDGTQRHAFRNHTTRRNKFRKHSHRQHTDTSAAHQNDKNHDEQNDTAGRQRRQIQHTVSDMGSFIGYNGRG